jgi:alcohol dehydrogenase
VNLAALARRDPGAPALARYAEAGRIVVDDPALHDGAARETLVATLEAWTTALGVPRLADFGVAPADLPALVAESRGSSMRTNPVGLTDAEIAAILTACL